VDRLIAAAMLLAPALAAARPLGVPLPPVTVEDTAGKPRTIPDGRLPLVVLYEDQNAGKQNVRAREVLGRFTDRPENRTRFEFMAIADLEKWNWWPARHYALADLRDISKRENTPVWCDWKGQLRRAWRLERGKSGILVLAPDGVVRFAAEGTLSAPQLDELVARLLELGATR
jgi:predicted transcriptional regulator